VGVKIRLHCDSGANVHSRRNEDFTLEELGFTEEERNELSDDEKYKVAEEWASNYLDIGYEEIEE